MLEAPKRQVADIFISIRVYVLFNANSSDKFFFFNNRGRSLAVLCRAKE